MKLTAAQYRAKFATAKPRRKPVQHEQALQIAAANELRRLGLCFYHPANEGDFPVHYRAKLKLKGTSSGVPDILVFESFEYEGRFMSGLAIELKNGKAGRVSRSQQEWIDDLRELGWRVEVCRYLDEVLEVLRECYPYKFKKVA